MTLTELQNEVYIITKRPDLTGQTLSALKNAILKMHTKDFYSKDIFETGIVFSSLETTQSLQYKLLFPRWRAISYIQPLSLDTSLGTYMPSGLPLDVVAPTFARGEYGEFKNNVAYEAGQVLQIRTYPGFQYFSLGAYIFPDLTDVNLSTWITEDYPYAAVYDAAATIFKSIGFSDQEASMRSLVAEQMQLITISNIQGVGY